MKDNEEQYFYNHDGKWLAFDDEQSGLGNVYTFEEFQAATVVELTTEQKIQQLESERDKILKSTDWYAVRMLENGTDIPADVSEYRELLRAIDELEGYPDIELPEQPDGIKFIY